MLLVRELTPKWQGAFVHFEHFCSQCSGQPEDRIIGLEQGIWLATSSVHNTG